MRICSLLFFACLGVGSLCAQVDTMESIMDRYRHIIRQLEVQMTDLEKKRVMDEYEMNDLKDGLSEMNQLIEKFFPTRSEDRTLSREEISQLPLEDLMNLIFHLNELLIKIDRINAEQDPDPFLQNLLLEDERKKARRLQQDLEEQKHKNRELEREKNREIEELKRINHKLREQLEEMEKGIGS